MKSQLIEGVPLLGFFEMFSICEGIQCINRRTVRPLSIGRVILPIECPYCGYLSDELASDMKKHYQHLNSDDVKCPSPRCYKVFRVLYNNPTDIRSLQCKNI